MSGGMESLAKFNIDDPTLEKPNAFGGIASQIQVGTMASITFERLAEEPENKSVVFIHNHPGAIDTGNLSRGWAKGAVAGPALAGYVVRPIIGLFGTSIKEAGERYLYIATSGAFGGSGPMPAGVGEGLTTRGAKSGGLFLVSRKCVATDNSKNMAELRAAAREKVWELTEKTIRPYL